MSNWIPPTIMEIQDILQKLEPIIPHKIAGWRRTLDIAEPDVKELLERQIKHTAYRLLGDFRKKILLSLPSEKEARGSFSLGTILYDKPYWSFGLSGRELTQHMAILGRSGAGKTNIAFHLLQQFVIKRIPFLFLDWKRTVRHLIPIIGEKMRIYTPGRSLSPFPFNPLIVPPGLERNVYLNHLIDLFSDAYTLGDGAKSILQKALATCFQKTAAPTIAEVLEVVNRMQTKGRATGWKVSATRALESYGFSDQTVIDAREQQAFMKSLLRQQTVVELDSLSQSSKKFLIPILCYWLYLTQLGRQEREKLRFVIFVEEAHHVLYRSEIRSKESMMNRLLRECRELGIGVVVIDQHPHLLSAAALGNCYCTILLNQKDPTDINKAAGLSLVPEHEKRLFSLLPVGQGIVKLQDRWRKPFLVQFPLVPVEKGRVTDSVLEHFLKGKPKDMKAHDSGTCGIKSGKREDFQPDDTQNGGKSIRQSSDDKEHFPVGDSMEEAGLFLLHDIVKFPIDGVKTRYDRLGLGMNKGHRLKHQLIVHGLIRPERVKVGRTHRVLLRLTDQARLLMVQGEGRDMQASFVHEYWKRFVARRFEKNGYKVTLESPRKSSNGSMDILAKKKTENIAIEIETGKSDVVANVKRDLLEGVSRVIVVATDERARHKVEKQLANEGLIITGRVELVLRDEAIRLNTDNQTTVLK